ncbi:MAG: flippase [Elusimicrobiota bacterium]|nr:flippase [Endomicrobiia bacterium]MDW8166549.1 flippase [Elusimicrobiota bacterium]
MLKIYFNLLETIKNWLQSKTKRVLLENFLSLSFLQVANYIFPLITLPYLVRVLKPEKYGLIAFANSFISYFMILTDYGFHLSAPREISINRDNKKKLAEIFSSVMVIKFFLMFLSLIIMTGIVFLFEKFRQDWLLYYLTFGMVLGHVMFPSWFFQGIENMKFITLLNIFAKFVFTILIFVFVKKQKDYYLVPFFNSLGFIIAGMLGFVFVRNLNVKFFIPKLKDIIYYLKEGFYIFISTIAISLYTISNTFILGLFADNTTVGYYAAAEKVIKAIQSLLTPLSNTFYPYISKIVNESKQFSMVLIRKFAFIVGLTTFLISLAVFMFADSIVIIFLGNYYYDSIIVLRILSFLPFIIGLSNVFGVQTMLPFNFKKAFSNILTIASLVNIVMASLLGFIYKHIGISFSVLMTETFVTISMFYYLHKKNIKLFFFKK